MISGVGENRQISRKTVSGKGRGDPRVNVECIYPGVTKGQIEGSRKPEVRGMGWRGDVRGKASYRRVRTNHGTGKPHNENKRLTAKDGQPSGDVRS